MTPTVETHLAIFIDETTFVTHNIQHSNMKFYANGEYQGKIVMPAGIPFAAAGALDPITGTFEIIACDKLSLDCQYWEATKNPF